MSVSIKPTEKFEFTPENLEWAKKQIAKYPEGRQQSAVMPLLHKAQEQNNGWITVPIMEYIADMLDMPYIRVHEVATFYSMYNLKPVGKHVIEVCTTTPCWLRGADDVVAACKEELGIGFGETTEDGEFTLLEVECAGACVNAPVMAYGGEYYEDLDADSTKQIIRAIKAGEKPKAGPQTARFTCCPMGGPTTLKDFAKDTASGDVGKGGEG
ncbi:NADH-quinone oxidoreductase subunit NuoE [Luteithermobacter gelatinilyticus]|uniref:NADH-quinone oxidoreductase subunit NuoE n=1 Tax=Luteithermobacter gelatinilyticus TaxID=2582913 RepID=UPI001107050B|nr:NADH-quinone oxidoreductase subunit NuoE [Luteithermobacter gelatinilyticus]